MSRALFSVCCLLAFGATLVSSTVLQYACGFHGYDASASCDAATGEVSGCPASSFGPYCIAGGETCAGTCVTANTEQAGGNDQCQTDNTCICKEGYDGADCSGLRIKATCDDTKMNIVVKPYDKYDGSQVDATVYFSDTDTIDFSAHNCKVDSSGGTATSEDLLYTAAGGNCNFGLTEVTTGTRRAYVYLQLMQNAQVLQDQMYDVQCTPGGGGDIDGNDITLVERGSNSISPTITTHTEVDDISMTIKTGTAPSFSDITAALNLGEPVHIILQHRRAFAPTTCIASPVDDFSSNSFNFIDEACVNVPLDNLYDGDITYANPDDGDNPTTEGGEAGNHVVRIPLKAWVHPGSTSVYIRCTVCLDDSCDIDPEPTCPTETASLTSEIVTLNNGLPAARRRRAVEVGATNGTTLGVNIIVNDKSGNVKVTVGGSDDESADVGSCYKSLSVLLPLILLIALLLVAMMMTFFFCQKLTRERDAMDGNTNMAYKS